MLSPPIPNCGTGIQTARAMLSHIEEQLAVVHPPQAVLSTKILPSRKNFLCFQWVLAWLLGGRLSRQPAAVDI